MRLCNMYILTTTQSPEMRAHCSLLLAITAIIVQAVTHDKTVHTCSFTVKILVSFLLSYEPSHPSLF